MKDTIGSETNMNWSQRQLALTLLLVGMASRPALGQLGNWETMDYCIHDGSDLPVFKYSGGYNEQMTPYMCIQSCMAQELHQRYDKELVVGVTQGFYCLCGYNFYSRREAGYIEELSPAADFCNITCFDGVSKCGGLFGRVSVYSSFAAPVTVGLNVILLNSHGKNVAIDYKARGYPFPPIPGYDPPEETTTLATTAATTAGGNSSVGENTNSTSELPSSSEIPTTTTTTPWPSSPPMAETSTALNPLAAYVESTYQPASTKYTTSTAGPNIISGSTKLVVYEVMELTIEVGEYKCSKLNDVNNETMCALKDSDGRQAMPPVNITVDYGDGSGEQVWTRDTPLFLWSHMYQLPGRYWVHVSTRNVYDMTGDEIWYEVEVVDPVFDNMGYEVVCPPVIEPGHFFICTADVPRGSNLTFEVKMTDDLDSNMITTSGMMKVPEQFITIPGGPLKHRAWNNSWDNSGAGAYVIRSTYFEYMGNLSAIEYVPATPGTLIVDIVQPVCPKALDADNLLVDTYWCPLTGACEIKCFSSLQLQTDEFTEWGSEWNCGTLDFCSLEGMCGYPDACPVSESGDFGGDSIQPYASKNLTDATGAQVATYFGWGVNGTYEITVSSDQLFKAQNFPISKHFFDDFERKQNRKNHSERTWFEWMHLAVRCPTDGRDCAYLAREFEEDESKRDILSTFDGTVDKGMYKMTNIDMYKRAVRPVLMEDRILGVEQKFFCDRVTEKTVTLTVTDSQDVPKTVTNSTKRISCQYPVAGVIDLSEMNYLNKENNTWKYIKTKETNCTGTACLNKINADGTIQAREYLATLWARVGETIRFHVNFTKGSHIIFSWRMFDQDSINHIKDDEENCYVESAPDAAIETWARSKAESQNLTLTLDDDDCIFPFRFAGVLYYACTNFTLEPDVYVHMCATGVDLDYHPTRMGVCMKHCPSQLPRRSETGIQSTSSRMNEITEGTTVFNGTYVEAVETEIVMDRIFKYPGYVYNLNLTSRNLHDLNSTNLIMNWKILCANPVLPTDWQLSYPKEHYFGNMFNVTLTIKPAVGLPTKPTIKVYAVEGFGKKPTAMRRYDHAPFVSMERQDFAIPFFIKGDKSVEANVTRWKGVTSGAYPNISSVPPRMYYSDGYTMQYLGMRNKMELNQIFPDLSPTAPLTNLKSGSGGEIGTAEDTPEWNYKQFTLCFPTIKYPGSYAFTVVMYNGISDIRYKNYWNLTFPEYYSENVSLLLPGGTGYTHYTGKAEDYCLKYPNGSDIIDQTTGLPYCESGDGIEVLIQSWKWLYNFVEIYERYEEPIEFDLKYVIPDENPDNPFALDFAKPKFFMPDDAHPYFTISLYKGTPRRIAYSFNNTEDPNYPIIYNPDFCYIDWPPDNLFPHCIYQKCDATPDFVPLNWKQDTAFKEYVPTKSWPIRHCPNITEGIYLVNMGMWNPLDGWKWNAKSTIVEILSRIGPIYIDDFNIINDVNQTKDFSIRFKRMGYKTCVTIDWDDGSPLQFYGNPLTCKQRYQYVTDDMVKFFDYNEKIRLENHVFLARGVYKITVTGFDERNYAEETYPVTIFSMPCKVPQVWLPVNVTSWKRPEIIPKVFRSKSYQIASSSFLECNKTVLPLLSWEIYSVEIKKDPNAPTAMMEELTEIQINNTMPTYTTSVLSIPPNILDYGLYKVMFKLEIPTGTPDFPLYRKAYTYITLVASPIEAGFIKGGVSKVTRGWGQVIEFDGKEYSKDPDFPEQKEFNYTWFCRRKEPNEEEWPATMQVDSDLDGQLETFPIYDSFSAQRIPKPRDPIIMDPPDGCFGLGPGPMKYTDAKLNLNTSSLITYAQVYEIVLVVSKGDRIRQTSLLVDVGVIPAPVVEIACAGEGLCFPTFGGVFVNPTSRLALKSNCKLQCIGGTLSYNWNIKDPGINMNTVSCDADLTTTSTTSTTTTTTTTTTTLPPAVTFLTTAFYDNSTQRTIQTATDLEGNIIVSVPATAATRRKRATLGLTATDVAGEEEVYTGPKPLVPDHIPVGCTSVFPSGTKQDDFSMTAEFFQMNPKLKSFQIELNITRCIDTGKKIVCSSGVTSLNIFRNDPPHKGTCKIKNLGQTEEYDYANPGFNTALLDIFIIDCQDWVDPNAQAIVKYVFKSVEQTPRGNETRALYAGPLANSKAVFGFGVFQLLAEIWDEAGAFALYNINSSFPTIMPKRDQYDAYEFDSILKGFTDTGDTSRTAMMLQAQASIMKSASWFSLEDLTADVAVENMTLTAKDNYETLLKDLTNKNTQLINTAAASDSYNTLEGLNIGASTLYTITSPLVKGGDVAKTLDMKGREAAVTLINKMNDGFKKLEVSDPSRLKPFIEGVTGSVLAILSSLNNVLYTNDPDDLPLTDKEEAASLPYDTDIEEGNADIPANPKVAFERNTMKVTRLGAVNQVKSMVNLVDDVCKNAVKSQVVGEVIRTKAPLGVSIIMAKVGGANTIGKDVTGDKIPDNPLTYTFKESSTMVQFPLNFCPGKVFDWTDPETGERMSQKHVTPDTIGMPCQGLWGVVVKEWQVIKQVYPKSALNLNRLTMTVDVDIYDENDTKVDVSDMPKMSPIKLTIGRMKEKDKRQKILSAPDSITVDVKDRLDTIAKRNRQPIIYHQVFVNQTYATINVQLKGYNPYSNLVIFARFDQLMTVTNCDFFAKVEDITERDGEWVNWFVGVDKIDNRTGSWYIGIAELSKDVSINGPTNGSCAEAQLSESHLVKNINSSSYILRAYVGGCYYFNVTTETWEGVGIEVDSNSGMITTSCMSDHLTSFGTGYFPTPNVIDFEFIFATTDLKDNTTMLAVVTIILIFFIIILIYSIIQDGKDIIRNIPHWMKDNVPEDHYIYEVVVQTGPMLSHGTTSKIQMIVTGEDAETQVRTLTDPERPDFFKKGSLDSFLMTTDRPLGHLQFVQIWHDNSGIREMQPWYLSYMVIYDIQTGEKFRFHNDQWLAIDREPYVSSVQIPAIPMDCEADMSFMMREGFFHKLKDDNIWWSVFSRPKRSRFTRTQRTCVSMGALCLSLLTNAMWYGVNDAYVDKNVYVSLANTLNITVPEIQMGVISSCIVFVPVVLIILMFRNAAPGRSQKNRIDTCIEEAASKELIILPEKSYQRELAPEEEKIPGWPGFCYFIAWILTVLCIFTGLGLVVFYSLQFGNEKTRNWFTSIIINFFWNVFVESSIKVGFVTLVVSCFYRKPDWNQDHLDYDQVIPTIYYDPEKDLPPPKPRADEPEFDPEYLEPLRFRRMQEGEMNATIQDILVYLVYLTIVLLVCSNRDINYFYMKDQLETTIVHGGLLCGRPEGDPCDPDEDYPFQENPWTGDELEANPYVDFMKVNDVNQFWLWLNRTLIPNVRVQDWYNGDPPYSLKGYLDDRVNRLIGFAVVRQIRERYGTCYVNKIFRDAKQANSIEDDPVLTSCTGDLTMPEFDEDTKDYCKGWKSVLAFDCHDLPEYKHKSQTERKASGLQAPYRTYSGGGYELRLKGNIQKLKDRIVTLQQNDWIDNRTRAIIVEFSVYNAQVNLFGIVRVVGEFIGGGIRPYFRIDVINLTRNTDFQGILLYAAELLFVVSTFYYVLNALMMLKNMGFVAYFQESWNIVDVATIMFSFTTIAMWAYRVWIVMDFTLEIEKTRGNEFISIDKAQDVNSIYDMCVSITVFTSILKLCRLLSFQKAFRQIAATIKLCFIGLSTFIVEFFIVFGSFCCFFYFMCSPSLNTFMTPVLTLENTIAMAIGKFNFSSLKAASETAAWIFFAFSIVVNMILINMMMAIINMAFEEIKEQKDTYQSKFNIVEYIKQSAKEMIGVRMAQRDLPVFKIDGPDDDDGGMDMDSDNEDSDQENGITNEFSDKTNQLLDYIEQTYFVGDAQGQKIVDKMRLAENAQKTRAMEYGFDSIFAEGPTPTPSVLGSDDFMEEVTDEDLLMGDDISLGVSMTNVDGMNIE